MDFGAKTRPFRSTRRAFLKGLSVLRKPVTGPVTGRHNATLKFVPNSSVQTLCNMLKAFWNHYINVTTIIYQMTRLFDSRRKMKPKENGEILGLKLKIWEESKKKKGAVISNSRTCHFFLMLFCILLLLSLASLFLLFLSCFSFYLFCLLFL